MSASAPSSEPQSEKRRSKRLMHAMPITVAGVDALGQPFREATTTVMVDCYGCKYISKHYPPKESEVTLEIPYPERRLSPRIAHGRVVWIQRPRTSRENYQVAVALTVPGNVWGIADPPTDWFPHPEDEELAVPVFQEIAVPPVSELTDDPADLSTVIASITDRKSVAAAAHEMVADEMKLLMRRLDTRIQQAVDATATLLLDRIASKAAKDISDEAGKHAAAILEHAQKACEETADVLEKRIRQLLARSAVNAKQGARKGRRAKRSRNTGKRKR